MNEDFVTFEIAEKLREKGFRERCLYRYRNYSKTLHPNEVEPKIARKIDYSEFFKCYNFYVDNDVDAPTIPQVLKWLRKAKNIDIEIRAEVGMLGDKVYVPFISTYTEFTLETSPDVVRYRQKKFNPTSSLPHEIIPALTYFKEWEEAALVAIEYVINNLI